MIVKETTKHDPLTQDVYDRHLGGFRSGPIGCIDTYDPTVWNYLYSLIKPTSVIDVGCGEGHSLNYFKSIGVKEIMGIDGCRAVYDKSPVGEDIFIVDFYRGSFTPSKIYDLTWSCEFVEHIDEECIPNFFSIFNKSKYVAMTHALVGQGGHHHVNCQDPPYWIELFEKNGFKLLEKESEKLRSISTAKYVKNTLKLFKNMNLD